MNYFSLLKKKDKKEISTQHKIDFDKTSLLKVIGNSNIGHFIYDGDILVIEKDVPLFDSAKVLVRIGGKECIKIYRIIGEFGYLQTSLSCIFPEKIGDLEYEVIGVITKIIHNHNLN